MTYRRTRLQENIHRLVSGQFAEIITKNAA